MRSFGGRGTKVLELHTTAFDLSLLFYFSFLKQPCNIFIYGVTYHGMRRRHTFDFRDTVKLSQDNALRLGQEPGG
jgi:hypothetical protein